MSGRRRFPRDPGAFKVERFVSVGSTQDVLRQRVDAGQDVTGLVIRTEAQTGGRGRRGTQWYSEPGGSYQSIGLGRVTAPPAEAEGDAAAPPAGAEGDAAALARLPLALAVGIAEALDAAGARTAVKWPNDLMLLTRADRAEAGRGVANKLGGLLVEVRGGQALAGVGVNVANPVPPGAAALRGWDVEVVSDLVLDGVREGLRLWSSDPAKLAERLEPIDWLRGKLVTLEVDGALAVGRAAGVDSRGCLLLKPTSHAKHARLPGRIEQDESRAGTSSALEDESAESRSYCRGHVTAVA